MYIHKMIQFGDYFLLWFQSKISFYLILFPSQVLAEYSRASIPSTSELRASAQCQNPSTSTSQNSEHRASFERACAREHHYSVSSGIFWRHKFANHQTDLTAKRIKLNPCLNLSLHIYIVDTTRYFGGKYKYIWISMSDQCRQISIKTKCYEAFSFPLCA